MNANDISKRRGGPLRGIRVLDLTRALAGPWCTQTLADLGAEVIKIERPVTGDESRQWGPPWLKDSNGVATSESAYFLATNRNKKSVVIDISKPDGQRLIKRLVEHADVLVENFKPGNLEKYGLDYGSLKKVKPDIIYCSITGFGQTGPYSKFPGYDYLFQGLGGIMSVTGEPDTTPGGAPQRIGLPIVDLFTGMYAKVAVLSALHERGLSGEGQHLDISLLDSVFAMGSGQLSNYFHSGQVPTRTGNAAPNISPYETFSCSDGDIIIACANQLQFEILCRTINHPEWITDPRFLSNAKRVENRMALRDLLAQVFVRKSMVEWERMLLDAGVPCGPINNYQQALMHPQVRHHRTHIELPHLTGGVASGVASPIRSSSSAKVEYWRAPPMLGQDTLDVLTEYLQFDADELHELEQQGVIGSYQTTSGHHEAATNS